MISINNIMKETGKCITSIRAKAVKMGIEPKYKTFTKGPVEVEYTKEEAALLIQEINKNRDRYDNRYML